jgi:pimeloyl-ACP methyl ester carboxylesterase
LNLPVLVIFGTLDAFLPPELARVYRELLPNCNTVFVYDAAHEVDADRPEAFVSLVNDFYDRHEAFLVNTRSSVLYE